MIRTFGRVKVTSEAHGPFVRHAFLPLDPPTGAQVSVVRIGDTLIDTASTRVTDALLAVLRDDPPRRVLLTHQHEDHIGNVRAIRDTFGAIPVHAPRALVDTIVALRAVPPYRAAHWGDPLPVERADLIPYDPDDVFEASGVALRALATPGHTPPHVAFVARARDRDEAYALTGDLFASRPLEIFFECAVDDAARSYRAVAALAREVIMLPTHGRVRLDGGAVLREAADWLDAESEAVVRLADALGTRDPVRVATERYGDDPLLRPSAGEIGKAVFVRGVLAPVRALPATPIALPG